MRFKLVTLPPRYQLKDYTSTDFSTSSRGQSMNQAPAGESSASSEPAGVDPTQPFIDKFLNLLNTSSLEELRNMKGINETRAAKIMEVRAQEETPFMSIADPGKIDLSMKQAKGLVKKEFARLLD